MAKKGMPIRGLIPIDFTRQTYPYRPRRHLGWIDALLARSDATVERAALRAAILRARVERLDRVVVKPMPQIFEVLPDGTVQEVSEPKPDPSLLSQVRTGFVIGGLLGLPLVLRMLSQSARRADRARRER